MKKVVLTLGIVSVFSIIAFAYSMDTKKFGDRCSNMFDCDIGEVCVKVSENIFDDGICMSRR